MTTATRERLAAVDRRALGVRVRLVVTDAACLPRASDILQTELAALDLACSRFRADSELSAVNRSAGRRVAVSPLLSAAIAVALTAARQTGGMVDPTLGGSMTRLGYDQDFDRLPDDAAPVAFTTHRVSHWSRVQLDRTMDTVLLPAGVGLDLGATAKAWCADRLADQIATELGCGVLVSLGGDIATAGGPPEGGWAVRVQERPTDAVGRVSTVSVQSGGLATSSMKARRWRRGGVELHHLLDPHTGMPAVSPWRTITVAAGTCLAANTASTSAIVSGRRGLKELADRRLPARLVDQQGDVITINGWPPESA